LIVNNTVLKLVAIVLIIIVTQVMGEFIVRIIVPQSLNPSLYKFDHVFAFTLKQNYTGFSKNLDYSVRLFTNSNGFRCNEERFNTISNQKILVVGDSYTFGTGVEYGESYPAVIQTNLHDLGVIKSDDVLNTGIPAWGTSQELLMIKKTIEKITPELIIWQICENDFDNNIQYGLHVIKSDSLISVKPNPTKRDRIRRLTTLIPLYDYLVQNSHLVNLYRKSIIILMGEQLSKTVENHSMNPEKDNELNKMKWSLMKKITQEIFEICEDDEIEILPIFIPSGGREIQKYGENSVVDSLFHYLNQNHREYIDFSYLGFNEHLRFSSDGHWKPRAHRLAADSLSNYIVNEYSFEK